MTAGRTAFEPTGPQTQRSEIPALRSHHGLAPILNLVPSYVIILDSTGAVIEANKWALDCAGLSRDDVAVKPVWECHWWSYAPEAQQKLRDAIATAANGKVARYELLIQTKNGSLVTVDFVVGPTFDAAGGVEHIVVSGVDISSQLAIEGHLRESEKRFRGTFENAAVGMAHVSLDSRWLRVNEVLLETLGYSQEEFLQMTLPQLLHPDDLAGHLIQFGQLKSGEIDRYTREKRYIKKNGQFVWVNVTASLQRSELGAPLYAILVIEEIAFRKEAETKQRLLVGELSHRVKNIMSMVQSIANQTLSHSASPEAYVAAFRLRLQAMSRAHELLTQESWQRADLVELIRSQATMNGIVDNERIKIDGPTVMLPGQFALNLALVMHELTSNAMRHGALSLPEGRIEIFWSIDETVTPKIIHLTWREAGGPPVRPPTELGFGARLVERSLKRGLGAKVDVAWEPSGLLIEIELPVPEMRGEDYFAP